MTVLLGRNILTRTIELLAAAQGVDLRAPLQTSARLQNVKERAARAPAFLREGSLLRSDIESAKQLVVSGVFNQHAAALLPSLAP